MTDEKKKIIALAGSRKPSDVVATDAEIFFRHPESLEQHIVAIAEVDANRTKNDPEKPATRVSSLDSFLTNSPKTSFSFKKSGNGAKTEQEGVIRIFGKPDTEKSRKK